MEMQGIVVTGNLELRREGLVLIVNWRCNIKLRAKTARTA